MTGGMNMNHTTNYQLSQWESTDRILMSDFNGDNAKIDAALKEHDDELAALTAAADGFGNCRIYFDTYTGTGSGATVLTFPKKPRLVYLTSVNDRAAITLAQGVTETFAYYGGSAQHMDVAWTETTVSITHPTGNMSYQCNYSGIQYLVVALISADE